MDVKLLFDTLKLLGADKLEDDTMCYPCRRDGPIDDCP